MVARRLLPLLSAVCIAALGATARADEGLWPPGQIAGLDIAHMGSLGLRLRPDQLWSENGGILRAAVKLPGCSGAFVSETGLVVTNHHCAYRAIRAQSSAEHDYLGQGFLAKKRSAELRAPGYTLRVLESVKDVTTEVRAVAKAAKSDQERAVAVDAKERDLAAACEKQAHHRCRVASFHMGREYKLFDSLEIEDVRVVYAPPASIGEFGGGTLSWTWPRHTGDFTVLRAYVGPDGAPADYSEKNVPFKPKQWLKIGADGVKNGDFVAILGYPRETDRYLTASEVARQVEQLYPATLELAGEWIGILDDAVKKSPQLAAKMAARRSRLEARQKMARGMIADLRQLGLVDRREKEEARLKSWAAEKPVRKRAVDELAAMDGISKRKRARFPRAFLLDHLGHGPDLLAVALDIVRPGAHRHWSRDQRRIADFNADVDARLLASLAARAKRLPQGQELDALAKLATGGVTAAMGKVRASRLSDESTAKRLFDDPAAAEKSRDPMIMLARALGQELDRLDAERNADRGLVMRIGPDYFSMLEAERGDRLYPDANGTLRLSVGTMRGYSPEDGLLARSQTSLHGAVEASTGEEPFNLPRAVVEKAPEAKESYWADPDLDDVPVCFLSNADTSGGGDGSAVVNGRGELVGLSFDRVWENVAGDLGYSVSRSRNINTDIRYMLWLLDRVVDAGDLLQELGAARYRSAPSRRERTQPLRRHLPSAPAASAKPAPAKGCGCTLPASDAGGRAALAVALLALAAARRRRARH